MNSSAQVFVESFNGGSIPPTWDNANECSSTSAQAFWKSTGSQTPGYNASPFVDHTGAPNSAAIWVDGSSPYPCTVNLTTDYIDVTTLTTPSIEFHWFKDNSSSLQDLNTLVISAVDMNGVYPLWSSTNDSSNWQKAVIDASCLNLDSFQIRFTVIKVASSASLNQDIVIDDIKVLELDPTYSDCVAPISIASFPTPNSASVDVALACNSSSTSYLLVDTAAGPNVAFGAPVAIVNGSVTLTGLVSGFDYEVYAYTDCGNGTSDTLGPHLFSTPCSAVATPYFEDFDQGQYYPPSTIFANDQDLGCFTTYGDNASYDEWLVGNGSSTTTTGPLGDASTYGYGNYLYRESSFGDRGVLRSPLLNLSGLTDPFFSFDYHYYGSSVSEVKIRISNDFGVTWTEHKLLDSDVSFANQANPFKNVGFSLAPYTGDTAVYVELVVEESGSSADFAIDNLSVDEAPACYNPIATFASVTPGLTTGSATFNFLSGKTVSYSYKEVGATSVLANGVLFSAQNTFSNLPVNKAYEFSFFNICTSSFSDTFSVEVFIPTLNPCAPQTAPYVETFEITSVKRQCWDANSGAVLDATWYIDSAHGNTSSFPYVYTNDTSFIAGEGSTFARLGTSTSTSGSPTDFSGEIISGVFDFSALSSLQIDLLAAGGPYTYASSWSSGTTLPDFIIEYRTSTSGSWNEVLNFKDTAFDGWTNVSIADPIIDLSSTMQFRFRYTGGGLPIAVDSISFKQGSTCVTPIGLASYNTTQTTTDFLWTGISSSYRYTYGEAVSGNVLGTNTTTAATASLSGLSPQTSYWVVVEGDCGGGTYTNPSDTLFFDTECSMIAAFPHVESFETTSVYEKCWTGEVVSGTPRDWDLDETGAWGSWSNTNAAYAGTEYAEGSSTSGIDVHRLISPILDASSLTTLEVSFYFGAEAWGSDQNSLELEYRLSDSDPWTTVWSSGGVEYDNWEFVEVVIPVTSSTMQVAFKETDEFGYGVVLDYITFDEGPTCLPTTIASIEDITTNSALITIDDAPADYEVYVELAGGSVGNPVFAQATGTSYTLTNDSSLVVSGLSSDSLYGVFVRRICGSAVGDTSEWRGPVSFKTLCAAQPLPLAEMFEGDDLGCWTQADVSSPGKEWTFNTGSNGFNSVSGPGEGTQYIRHTGSFGGPHTAKLVSPVLDVNGINTIDISFLYDISAWGGDQNEMKVYVRSFPSGQWVEYLHLDQNTQATWTDSKVTVNVAADTNVQVAFEAIDEYGYPAALDSVYIEEGPFCPEPANVTFVPTNNSVTITWDSPNGTNSGSNIEWGALNFVQGTGAAFGLAGDTAGVTSPFTISGLSPDSTYWFYVQDSCTNGDVTAWAGPFEFRTTCVDAIAPYLESFDTRNLNSCWSNTGGETWLFTGASFPSPDYGASQFVDRTNNGGYAMFFDASGSSQNANPPVLRTQNVDISALSNPELEFFIGSNNVDNSIVNNLVVSIIDANGKTDSVVVVNTMSVDWQRISVDLNGYTSPVSAEFTAYTDEVNTGSLIYHDIVIDDISFDEVRTCFPSTDLTATTINANDATLSWTAGAATGTDWVVTVTSSTTGVQNVYHATSNNFTVTGLNGGAEYCATVQEICNATGDTTAATSAYCFTTACGVTFAPYSQDFASYQYDFNCWVRSNNVSGSGSGSTWESTYGDWMVGGVENVWGNTPSNSTWRSINNNYAMGVNGSAPFAATPVIQSPMIDVSGLLKPQLKFQTISGQEGDTVITWLGDTISNGQNTLVVDLWDGAAWNDSVYVNNSDTVAWDSVLIELNQYNVTGPVQVRFTVNKTAVIPAFDDILLDNFAIEDDPAILTCSDIDSAYAFDMNCGDAMIAWGTVDTAGVFTMGSADTNRIGTVVYVGTDSLDMMAGMKYFTTDTAAAFVDGLTPGTDYFFWAMDSCISGNTSSVIGPFHFTTDTVPMPTVPSIASVNDTVTTTSDWTITLTGDSTQVYTWDIDGMTYTGMVANPSFTSNDTVDVTLTIANDCGSMDTTFQIVVTQIGQEENILADAKIYPNPSNGNFNVEFSSIEGLDYSIQIMDAMGRLISTKEGVTAMNNTVRIDANLPSGVYIVKTIVGSETMVDRVSIRN